MKTCFGLLGLIIFCPDEAPTTVSDFCTLAGPEIQNLRRLSEPEARALKRPRHEALRNLKTYYDRKCSQPDPMKRK